MDAQVQAQEQAYIQEMIAKAEKIGGEVVMKGDATTVVRPVSDAGYVWIWDTRTGDKSKTNVNMLPTQLKKKREDGSRVFTTVDPGITPFRGKLKCLLHPDDPNREHYTELGFGTCRKSNLVSPFQVEQHMKKKHKQEFAAMEQERIQREKQEDRDFQRSLLRPVQHRQKRTKKE